MEKICYFTKNEINFGKCMVSKKIQISWKGTALFFMYIFRCTCLKNKTLITMPAYAVINGYNSCVVNTWEEAKSQCIGVPNSYCKKFKTEEEAQDYIASILDNTNAGKRKIPVTFKSTTQIDRNATKEGRLDLLKLFSSKLNSVKSELNNLSTSILEKESHFGSTKIAEKLRTLSNAAEKSLDKLCNKVVKYMDHHDTDSDFSSDSDISITPKIKRKKTTDSTSNKSFDNSITTLSTSITNDQFVDIRKNSTTKTSTDTSDLPDTHNKLRYDPDGYVVVYTDGSCLSNGYSGARAGIGVWFGPSNTLNVAEPVKGKSTNNNAEIQAATVAIVQANSIGVKKLRIYSDSMFMINCITQWLPKWKANNWKLSSGGPVKNKEQLQKLDAAVKLIDTIDWQYVKGHADSIGNKMADELARIGAAKKY